MAQITKGPTIQPFHFYGEGANFLFPELENLIHAKQKFNFFWTCVKNHDFFLFGYQHFPL